MTCVLESGVPAAQAGPLSLSDLPEEVLALTVALGLTRARDVACFAACSRRCAAVCKAAPLRLAVAARPSSPSEEQAEVRAQLRALCNSWPGTAQLNLQSSALEDADVLRALASLQGLEVLQLSGCNKLTPALPAALARAPHPQLRYTTLQRCFQLTCTALSDMLEASAQPGSKLTGVALSHLCLASWPDSDVPLPGQLRALALHNCSKVTAVALHGVAAACPQLEVLMLGGTSFTLEAWPPAEQDGLGASLAGDPHSAVQLFDQALAAVVQGPPLLIGSAAYVASVAMHLAALVARLPRLRVLELTFGLPGLAHAVQHLADTEPLMLAGRPQPVQVWDLTTAASVTQALTWRRGVLCRDAAPATGSAAFPGRPGIAAPDADALLRAAVNCSSAARQTPLHAAAEDGGAAQLRALLRLGARVDARDRGGATPLFLACEAGRLLAVECLLRAGACATMKNSAGEAPLYIAALKGHEHVVDALLCHCEHAGISWQAHRDGDSWTPLMAAAVGGRTSIVHKLLHAAGAEAADLVQAANRYGQTTLHIAARKGSASLLKALVEAGGAASLHRADADGRTAAEIARNMRNGSAMRVLGDASAAARRDAQRHRATQPTAERPRANDHRQQHTQQRWVGRRLQQRKTGSGAQGNAAAH